MSKDKRIIIKPGIFGLRTVCKQTSTEYSFHLCQRSWNTVANGTCGTVAMCTFRECHHLKQSNMFWGRQKHCRSMFLHLPAIFGYKSWQKFILAYYQRQSVVLLFDMCVISVAVCRGQIMQDSHEITEKTYTGKKNKCVTNLVWFLFKNAHISKYGRKTRNLITYSGPTKKNAW